MTKVLLVEDDAWLAELEAGSLQQEGFTVHTVAHGFDAIEAIDSFVPEVIILDVLLAGTTAFSLLHELQSYQDTGKIPVILCTNLAEHLAENQFEAYGVKRIVDKTTMHPSDLAAAVRAVLGIGVKG